ncbi:hypothetical protein M758_6G056300 [Ceratodon purpureus]|nr:hypothetical protein M758_6G056300 [Ceratodon purpureus]
MGHLRSAHEDHFCNPLCEGPCRCDWPNESTVCNRRMLGDKLTVELAVIKTSSTSSEGLATLLSCRLQDRQAAEASTSLDDNRRPTQLEWRLGTILQCSKSSFVCSNLSVEVCDRCET